jgi:hypothetical protein
MVVNMASTAEGVAEEVGEMIPVDNHHDEVNRSWRDGTVSIACVMF